MARFRAIRDDGWARGETVIAEGDDLEELLDKLEQKTGGGRA